MALEVADIIKQDRLGAGTADALFAVAGQSVNSDLANILDAYYHPAGKVARRGPVAGSTKKKVKLIVPEALSGEGTYPRPNGDLYYSRKWGEHDDVKVLQSAREVCQYVLLYGAPGCGKTALAEAAFGEELHTILGSGDTEVSDLVGGYVQTPSGGFEWIDGPLLKAAENGQPLLIDEIGLIDPKVLSIVYGLMDGRREYLVSANPERGTVKAKDGFYIIAATNPDAPGVRLSEALLSRFTLHVEMTTDWGLAKKLGAPAPIVTAAQNLSKKQLQGEVSWAPQMRELLGFRDVAKRFGTQFAIGNLLAAAPALDRPVVADVFTRVFGEECRPAKI